MADNNEDLTDQIFDIDEFIEEAEEAIPQRRGDPAPVPSQGDLQSPAPMVPSDIFDSGGIGFVTPDGTPVNPGDLTVPGTVEDLERVEPLPVPEGVLPETAQPTETPAPSAAMQAAAAAASAAVGGGPQGSSTPWIPSQSPTNMGSNPALEQLVQLNGQILSALQAIEAKLDPTSRFQGSGS
jgi:hypothetical protein